MKMAMINVYKRLKEEKLDARIVMQVHDELVVETALPNEARVKELLREEMEGVTKLSVPLTVDVTSGRTWLDQE